jgi:hypothetical protein
MSSDTPRTDAVMERGQLQRPTLSELAEHARALERELAESKQLIETLTEEHNAQAVYLDELDALRRELAAEKARGAIAVADVDVVRDFEAKITPHILRNWDRSRIVGFAKHLLGDECQECQKHNKPLDTPPRP